MKLQKTISVLISFANMIFVLACSSNSSESKKQFSSYNKVASLDSLTYITMGASQLSEWSQIEIGWYNDVVEPVFDKYEITIDCNPCEWIKCDIDLTINQKGRMTLYTQSLYFECNSDAQLELDIATKAYFRSLEFNDPLRGIHLNTFLGITLGQALDC